MYNLFFIIIGLFCFENVNSYVLSQARKQNDNLTRAGSYYKMDPPKSDRHLISRVSGGGGRRSNDKRDISSLESVILAIDTGVKQLFSGQNKPDIVDSIAKTVIDFAKNAAKPIYRTKGQEYDIKSEVVNFRSDKPSVMFELNSKSILDVLKDLLQSKAVRRYMDKFSKEAAVVYSNIKQELDNAKREKERTRPSTHFYD